MKVSVITPTVRPESLDITVRCLKKQTFHEFEWIVVCPKEKEEDMSHAISLFHEFPVSWKIVVEPPKRKEEFYGLCKAYNAGFKRAEGQLIISLQDGIWIEPSTLQHFWDLYEADTMSCVGALGNQYTKIDPFGKPTSLYWQDPRITDKHGSYYQIYPVDTEFTLCSFPRQAVLDVGGFEEEFDRGAAVGEKEMALRMEKAGYRFFLDQSLLYRAVHHPRLTEDWDKYYDVACKLFETYNREILNGNRLKLNYL